jgi:hypothetical protein
MHAPKHQAQVTVQHPIAINFDAFPPGGFPAGANEETKQGLPSQQLQHF